MRRAFARLRALPAGLLVAVGFTLVVAAGAGVLSWDANTWAAGEVGVDPGYRWLYGIVIDGAIAVGAAGIFQLSGGARVVTWTVMLAALGVSLVGNGAHARPGSALHTIGSMVPPLLLALCLLVLELMARQRSALSTARARAVGSGARARRTTGKRDGARASARDRVRILVAEAPKTGASLSGTAVAKAVGVHPGHARKLLREVAAGA